jgi:DNA helicase-2/ATP-dependent DNA helicase PcrA
MRILAGPGTGKTQALVQLYSDLVGRGLAGRGEILVLTFSTSAADEIGRRLDERLVDSYDQAWISTFHSFCGRLLRDHRPDPSRLLLSGFQEWVAMRRILAGIEPERLGILGRVRESDAFAQDALAFVALLKQNLVYPARFQLAAEASGSERLRALATLYSTYQARLEEAGMLDFRDLVAGAIGLLEARPALLDLLRARFRYVLVDEFQDVDPAQFELLRLIAPPQAGPKLVVVGDADQSIYGFRGTVPSILTAEFPRAYGSKAAEIGLCRRCPPEVLEAGERLLRETHPERRHRELATTGRGVAPAVVVVGEANGLDEAFYVAREIKRVLVEARGELTPGDFAILLRSTSALAAPFEEALRALAIPYEVRGLGAIARNEVVRFLCIYLSALAYPDDPERLEQLLASGLSGVGARAAGRLRAYALERGRPLHKVVRQLMYRLAEKDPAGFPLPWSGPAPEPAPVPTQMAEAPTGNGAAPTDTEVQLPDYVEFMSEDELRSLHSALRTFYDLSGRARRLPVHALAYAILIEAGVVRRLLEMSLEESQRREALADLKAAIGGFAELEEVFERLTGERPALDQVASRMEGLLARAVDDTQPASSRHDAVQILTVHQAKGLEFDVVFMAGLAHGVFPLATRPHPLLSDEDRAWLERELHGFRPAWPADSAGHLAEEARLAYVGMTRARKRLYLTYADEYEQRAGPSPFIELAAPDREHSRLSRARARVEPESFLTMAEAETLLALSRPGIAGGERSRLVGLGVDIDWVLDPLSGRPFEPYRCDPPAEILVRHFSATALNDYLRCPRLYWYNHHPGLVTQARSVEMDRGSFLHEVLEDFHSREAEWRTLPPESQREWLKAALDSRLESYLNKAETVLDRQREQSEVRRILDNYIRFATSLQRIPRYGTLATEKRFVLQVDGAEIHGKIDRINDTGNGTCEVVDYKTGRGVPAGRAYDNYFGPEMYDVQLGVYYLACRDGHDPDGNPIGLEPRFLSVWYPKEWIWNSIRQVLFAVGQPAGLKPYMERVIGPEELDRSRAAVTGATEAIRSGRFGPAPRDVIGTCLSYFGCPHSAICPFGGTPAD